MFLLARGFNDYLVGLRQRASWALRPQEQLAALRLRVPREEEVIEFAFQNAAAFERWYAENSGVTIEWLHEHGRYGKPCDCGESECTGWQMAYENE